MTDWLMSIYESYNRKSTLSDVQLSSVVFYFRQPVKQNTYTWQKGHETITKITLLHVKAQYSTIAKIKNLHGCITYSPSKKKLSTRLTQPGLFL